MAWRAVGRHQRENQVKASSSPKQASDASQGKRIKVETRHFLASHVGVTIMANLFTFFFPVLVKAQLRPFVLQRIQTDYDF